MDNEKSTEKSTEKLPAKRIPDQNTYILLPSDDNEVRICRQYFDETYPTSKAKLVTDLKLQRLTNEHTLTTLSRDVPERPKFVRLDGGLREALPSDMPVRMGQSIRISDFWTEDGEAGVVDHLALVRAIAKQVLPLRPVYSPLELSVRLMMN